MDCHKLFVEAWLPWLRVHGFNKGVREVDSSMQSRACVSYTDQEGDVPRRLVAYQTDNEDAAKGHVAVIAELVTELGRPHGRFAIIDLL